MSELDPLTPAEERDARRGWRVPQERWIATLDEARAALRGAVPEADLRAADIRDGFSVRSDDYYRRVASGIAYAIARIEPPIQPGEGIPALSARLAPLVVESGYLSGAVPEAGSRCGATQQTETWGLMWCGLFAGHEPRDHVWFSEDQRPVPEAGSREGLRAAIQKASDDLLNDEMSDLEPRHLDSRFREFARRVRAALGDTQEPGACRRGQQPGNRHWCPTHNSTYAVGAATCRAAASPAAPETPRCSCPTNCHFDCAGWVAIGEPCGCGLHMAGAAPETPRISDEHRDANGLLCDCSDRACQRPDNAPETREPTPSEPDPTRHLPRPGGPT